MSRQEESEQSDIERQLREDVRRYEPDLRALAAEQSYSPDRAWIVYPDGRKFGPFESADLAIQVRVYVERVERREDLAVVRDSELGSRS